MNRHARRLTYTLAAAALGGWLFQAGCVRMFQQDVEVLFAPQANLTMLWGNQLVELFGPQILRLFQ